jgi:hypothetical protein
MAVRKKSTISRMAQETLTVTAYGKEHSPGSDKNLAYTWYRYSCEDNQAKEFLLDYFSKENDIENYNIFAAIDHKIVYGYASTACWIARMLTIGFQFSDTELIHFHKLLKRAIDKNYSILQDKAEEANKEITRFHSPLASKFLENYHSALNEILDAISIHTPKAKSPNISIDGTLKKFAVHKFYKKDFVRELKEIITELDLVITKTDMELYQRYTEHCHYSNLMLKRKKEFINNIIYYAEIYFDKISSRVKTVDVTNVASGKIERVVVTVEKAARKPRKKPVASPEKRISRLQYMKAFPELKLVSVDPRKLLGAAEVWLYNTKYLQLQVYRAASQTGLDIKGTSLLNYDEAKSQTKRIGKKTGEITAKVLSAGKVALRRLMDEINATATEGNGRLGENVIILRII